MEWEPRRVPSKGAGVRDVYILAGEPGGPLQA